MSSRLILLFVCDQAEDYSVLLSEFRSVDFEFVIARNLAHAKRILQTRNVDAIILRHDSKIDDRSLATELKHIKPRIPIYLVTDQPQPRQAGIDSVWRAEIGDEVATRAMALFFRHLFTSFHPTPGRRPVLSEHDAFFDVMRIQGLG